MIIHVKTVPHLASVQQLYSSQLLRYENSTAHHVIRMQTLTARATGLQNIQHIALHFWPSPCSLGLLGLCKLSNKSTYFFALNNVKRGQHVFKLCRNLQQLLFACSNYKAHTDIIAVFKTTFYYSNMHIDCIRPWLLQNCGWHGGSLRRFTLHYGVSSVLPWRVCLSAALEPRPRPQLTMASLQTQKQRITFCYLKSVT